MIQKCSLFAVLNEFFKEPTRIHFIREISREINLAHTSIKRHIDTLLKESFIQKKKSNPFDGYIANRENEKFILYKRAFNLISLEQVILEIKDKISPKVIVLFGSYEKGEDIEGSDIDILLISKVKKNLDFSKYEKQLKRQIHMTTIENLKELDFSLRNNVKKGIIIEGELNE